MSRLVIRTNVSNETRITIVQPGTRRQFNNIYPRILRTVPRPSVVIDFNTNKQVENRKAQVSFYMEPEECCNMECGICLNSEVRNCRMVLLTDCGHSICDECLGGIAESKMALVCPYCREDIDNVEVQSGESFNTLKNHDKVFKTDL